MKRRLWTKLGAAVGAAVILAALWAQAASAADRQEAEIKLQEAALIVQQAVASPDGGMPQWLLMRARALVLVPDMIKAGFLVGGNYGTGVVVARMPDGSWSAPAFYSTGGPTLGLQIGAQSADVILVVMNERGLQGLLHNNFKLGVDAAVTAGPVGRQAAASLSAANPRADIYSYSRSKGIFAGATLEGGIMDFDEETVRNYYGQPRTAAQLLLEKPGRLPPAAQFLTETLHRLSR